jgi:hypothetical protein
MKKRDRKLVKQNEVQLRELPPDAMEHVRKLVDSARQEEKKPEHVDR